MPHKMILVGTGGFGGAWCKHFLPPNVADGLIEVVAAVDVNPDALKNAREHLRLPESKCYSDGKKAFDEAGADCCAIVSPPAFHEEYVDLAIAHDMDIISEKPIADTLEGSIRIVDKVKRAGTKMGVTMSHRFDQDKTTMRRELRSGAYGQLDYLVGRYTCDCRKYGCWGEFRHKMADVEMIEAAVHHLDILADFADAKCDTIYAQTWTPHWGEFAGDANTLVVMNFENGVRASFEAGNTVAVGINGWTEEYFRAECEKATLILDHRRVERFDYDPAKTWRLEKEGTGETVPLIEQPKWSNTWLIEKFVRWLDGGEPMETNVEDNLQAMAIVFAGIESNRSGRPVKVQQFLANARAR
jgi:predicted dehydrogenase